MSNQMKGALQYVFLMLAFSLILNWLDSSHRGSSFLIICNLLVGICNVLYGLIGLGFSELGKSFEESPRFAFKKGIGLILFSIILWVIFEELK